MKTQCSHCQAKFKAPDESTGKKVNCPKCNQPFVISPLIKDTMVEVCSHCGKKIAKLEQACVFNDKIVCQECYDRLIRGETDIEPDTASASYRGRTPTSKLKIVLIFIAIAVVTGSVAYFALTAGILNNSFPFKIIGISGGPDSEGNFGTVRVVVHRSKKRFAHDESDEYPRYELFYTFDSKRDIAMDYLYRVGAAEFIEAHGGIKVSVSADGNRMLSIGRHGRGNLSYTSFMPYVHHDGVYVYGGEAFDELHQENVRLDFHVREDLTVTGPVVVKVQVWTVRGGKPVPASNVFEKELSAGGSR